MIVEQKKAKQNKQTNNNQQKNEIKLISLVNKVKENHIYGIFIWVNDRFCIQSRPQRKKAKKTAQKIKLKYFEH